MGSTILHVSCLPEACIDLHSALEIIFATQRSPVKLLMTLVMMEGEREEAAGIYRIFLEPSLTG